eukprot:TRINITY_DN153_c0_g2_i3.p1 TRINITY_DN153_c0_g2~~TRINITY_DN153_c0_g2_i3.p1  ORF type:complete len:391 (+),score=198.75 TRINITY_DN153_c0_g2_i3:107-1279(+)
MEEIWGPEVERLVGDFLKIDPTLLGVGIGVSILVIFSFLKCLFGSKKTKSGEVVEEDVEKEEKEQILEEEESSTQENEIDEAEATRIAKKEKRKRRRKRKQAAAKAITEQTSKTVKSFIKEEPKKVSKKAKKASPIAATTKKMKTVLNEEKQVVSVGSAFLPSVAVPTADDNDMGWEGKMDIVSNDSETSQVEGTFEEPEVAVKKKIVRPQKPKKAIFKDASEGGMAVVVVKNSDRSQAKRKGPIMRAEPRVFSGESIWQQRRVDKQERQTGTLLDHMMFEQEQASSPVVEVTKPIIQQHQQVKEQVQEDEDDEEEEQQTFVPPVDDDFNDFADNSGGWGDFPEENDYAFSGTVGMSPPGFNNASPVVNLPPGMDAAEDDGSSMDFYVEG